MCNFIQGNFITLPGFSGVTVYNNIYEVSIIYLLKQLNIHCLKAAQCSHICYALLPRDGHQVLPNFDFSVSDCFVNTLIGEEEKLNTSLELVNHALLIL